MTLKSKISIFTFIMFLSLISIGFASWTIATPEQNKTTDNSPITAEDAINSYEHVSIVSSTNFTYFSNSFTNADGELTDSGNVTIKLNIKKTCKSLSFELKFSSDISAEMTIFDSITYSTDNSGIPSGTGTKIEIEDLDFGSNESIEVEFTFVFTKATNFKEDVYSVLKDNTNIFAVSLTVNELNPVEE